MADYDAVAPVPAASAGFAAAAGVPRPRASSAGGHGDRLTDGVRSFLSSLRSHVEERVNERLNGLEHPTEIAALMSAAVADFPFLAEGDFDNFRGGSAASLLAGLRGTGGASTDRSAASGAAGRVGAASVRAAASAGTANGGEVPEEEPAKEGAAHAETARETDCEEEEHLDFGDGNDEGNYSDDLPKSRAEMDGIVPPLPMPGASVDDVESPDRKPAELREENEINECEPSKIDEKDRQDSPKRATGGKGKQSTTGKPKLGRRSAKTMEDEEEYEPSDDDEDDTLRPIKRHKLSSGSAKSKSKSKSTGRGRGRPRLDGRPPIPGGEKPKKPNCPAPKFTDARLRGCRLYLERHGHLSIPSDYDDEKHRDLHRLGAWAAATRDDYRRFVAGEFPEGPTSRRARTRVQVARGLELLEELGFDFGVEDGDGDAGDATAAAPKKPAAANHDAVWNWRLEKCRAYKSENAHLNPSVTHPAIGGDWSAHMRELYDLRLERGQGALTPVQNTRVRKLVEMGFCFDKVFDVHLQKLEAYKKVKVRATFHGYLQRSRLPCCPQFLIECLN